MDISSILQATSHRPYPMPTRPWKYYHEWHRVIFYHWPVSVEELRLLVPSELELHLFEGQAWVSLVAFQVKNVHPRFLPSMPLISNFHEINFRTYVKNNTNAGIYFLTVEGQKLFSVLLTKFLTGVPYEKSTIIPKVNEYESRNRLKGYYLNTTYQIGELISNKTELDKWLTERYRVYVDKDEKMYTFDIHHQEWKLNKLEITYLDLVHPMGKLSLDGKTPTLTHYSSKLKTIMWGRQLISN